MDERIILLENAHEKLEAAKNLFENEFYNDSVSRAYYAMFFAAKALLLRKNIHPKTHRGLISQFGMEFVKNNEFKKELFDLLARAQEDREEADYGLFSKIGENEAKTIIKGAELFLDECELLL
ncbi:HEPN domain-containing protein [Methanobacterium alcaliphilum]|uniref:HEPN domain-containing protein n=1 Tax=Methanobacterium alcaliphilum TaxID=392018 RepID=UPI00200A6687|nr:HEPN domain-containing protein [Methanobacterium alcaliphilum]MCK9150522.1 HEPN domain-containing protein [Methanobacterium alcaliphilum]